MNLCGAACGRLPVRPDHPRPVTAPPKSSGRPSTRRPVNPQGPDGVRTALPGMTANIIGGCHHGNNHLHYAVDQG
jgi:hypothetical protein